MILDKYLQKAFDEDTLITIESSSTNDDFSGKILYHCQDYVCMTLYSNDGRYNGICLFETDSIDEIYWGNREHLGITKLIERNNLALSPKPIIQSSFKEALLSLAERHNAIEIYVNSNSDDFDIGKIIEHDDEYIYTKTYGPKKSLSNLHKIIKLQNISFVVADSPYLNDILHLHSDPEL